MKEAKFKRAGGVRQAQAARRAQQALALAPEIPAGKQRLHVCAGNSLKWLRSGESVYRARHGASDHDRRTCKIPHYGRPELSRWR